ncbi:MAG: TIGR04168 family protein, partial [Phycisphaerales bacterium]
MGGDEDPALVREIAGVAAPKVVMLGNHDAWQSCSNKKVTAALRDSLEALGDDHLAYRVRDVHEARISVVGARPFSWGGPSLRAAEVYQELYGFHTMRQSAVRIVEAVR